MAAIEDPDFLDCGQGLHLQYGGYLVRVGLDSLLSGQISEELARKYSEVHFSGLDFTLNFCRRANASPSFSHG